MTIDQIGIALGCLVGVLMALVFILFCNDIEQYVKCPITDLCCFGGMITLVALFVTVVVNFIS